MTYYVQRKDGRDLETVDQFETYKEAREMVKEYRLSDRSVEYYISSRCCKQWKEEDRTMLNMLEVLHEMLYSLHYKDDPQLNYIRALELAIEQINNNEIGRAHV